MLEALPAEAVVVEDSVVVVEAAVEDLAVIAVVEVVPVVVLEAAEVVLVAEAVPLAVVVAVVVLAAVVVEVVLAEAVVRRAVPRLSLSLIVTLAFSLSVVARKMVSQLEI